MSLNAGGDILDRHYFERSRRAIYRRMRDYRYRRIHLQA